MSIVPLVPFKKLVNNIPYQLLFHLSMVWECVTSGQVCAPFEFGIINEGLPDLGPEFTFFGLLLTLRWSGLGV